MAMTLGGDDFIGKPFDPVVSVAKVQALLRRTYDYGNAALLLEHNSVILNTGDSDRFPVYVLPL